MRLDEIKCWRTNVGLARVGFKMHCLALADRNLMIRLSFRGGTALLRSAVQKAGERAAEQLAQENGLHLRVFESISTVCLDSLVCLESETAIIERIP